MAEDEGGEVPPTKLAISGGSVGVAFLFIVICWFTSSASKPPKDLPKGHDEMEVVFKARQDDNNFLVEGKIKITTTGTGLSFKQTLEWDNLEGVIGTADRTCYPDVKADKDDGCVIAMFDGTDCLKEAEGHHVHPAVVTANAAKAGQTWANSTYQVKRDSGENKATPARVIVRTGYASWDIEGRVVHVHDAWGRTIGCGKVTKVKKPSGKNRGGSSEADSGGDASALDRLEVV